MTDLTIRLGPSVFTIDGPSALSARAAARSAALAGQYSNASTPEDIPGAAPGERGSLYWAQRSGAIANADTDADVPGFASGQRGSKFWAGQSEQSAGIAADAADRSEMAAGNAAIAVSGVSQSVDSTRSLSASRLAYQNVGTASQSLLSANIGVLQFAVIGGVHVQPGQQITEMAISLAAATGAVRTQILVYRRNRAAATAAGTLNLSAPQPQDTLVGPFNTTPAALGVTPGTNAAVETNRVSLGAGFRIEEGFDYIFDIRNFDSSNNLLNMGYRRGNFVTEEQRRRGFTAPTANPTTFTNNATAVPSVTLYCLDTRDRLAQTDADLRALIENREIETLAAMNERNAQNVYAQAAGPFRTVLDRQASDWGDSLIGGNTAGEAGFQATVIKGRLVTGTVNQFGVGGQNSDEIRARVQAATAPQKAGYNYFQMSANDFGSFEPTTTMANIALSVAEVSANYIVATPWSANSWANAATSQRRMFHLQESIVATYGNRALDNRHLFARYGADRANNQNVRGGAVPTYFKVDNIHINAAGGLVKGINDAAILIADAGGPPYVHDDMFGWRSTDASGTVIGTVRTLGTAQNFTILGGNEDGAFAVNSLTGAITRTGLGALRPYREIFIGAENREGKGRNGRIILVQRNETTRPDKPVRVRGNIASVMSPNYNYAPTPGPQCTLVVAMRLINTSAAQILTGGGPSLSVQAGGSTLRFSALNTLGAQIGLLDLPVQSPLQFNLFTFSLNTTTGFYRGRCNLQTPVTGAAAAGDIDFRLLTQLFDNASLALPFAGDLMMMALYDQSYDITSDAVIARWWDNATRTPNDIGATGTAGGVLAQPLIYLGGMAGDLLLGANRGSGGVMQRAIPISGRDAGFGDVAR